MVATSGDVLLDADAIERGAHAAAAGRDAGHAQSARGGAPAPVCRKRRRRPRWSDKAGCCATGGGGCSDEGRPRRRRRNRRSAGHRRRDMIASAGRGSRPARRTAPAVRCRRRSLRCSPLAKHCRARWNGPRATSGRRSMPAVRSASAVAMGRSITCSRSAAARHPPELCVLGRSVAFRQLLERSAVIAWVLVRRGFCRRHRISDVSRR